MSEHATHTRTVPHLNAAMGLFVLGASLVLIAANWVHVSGVDCTWTSPIRPQHSWVVGSAPLYWVLFLSATTSLALGTSLLIGGRWGVAMFVPVLVVSGLLVLVAEPRPCAEADNPVTLSRTPPAQVVNFYVPARREKTIAKLVVG